jgi:5-methylcytosine-specific restriction endonuclease McrA
MREIRDLLKERRKQLHQYWGQCAYCGSADNTTLDHVKPKFRGGSENTSNLVSCCPKCNLAKGSQEWKTWYQNQSFYSVARAERIENWIVGA